MARGDVGERSPSLEPGERQLCSGIDSSGLIASSLSPPPPPPDVTQRKASKRRVEWVEQSMPPPRSPQHRNRGLMEGLAGRAGADPVREAGWLGGWGGVMERG